MSSCEIIQGDCLEKLRELPDASVQCCVTSPPYWGLRDYGCDGQFGLEKTPQEYVARMVEVFGEVRRALRDDGTLWLNLGDSYSGGGNYRGITSESTLSSKQSSNRGARGVCQELGSEGKETGVASKNLVGIPWRVAFALQSDGWYLRSDIIWSKPNPMPESVTDRPTKAHEYIFLLSKRPRYYYDYEAIKEIAIEGCDLGLLRGRNGVGELDGVAWHAPSILNRQLAGVDSRTAGSGFRNRRTVWTVATSPYPESHFATFPPDLIKPCILAGTKPGDTVLDPFGGSGTTGQVALELGRKAILIELNPAYVELIKQRTFVTPGLPI